MKKFFPWMILILGLCIADHKRESGIVINEIMASNASCFADSSGEYDDWIELFNPSTKVVTISGMYITDDLSKPKKWKIPDSQSHPQCIPPKKRILLWFDEDVHQGPLHINAKLSRMGEHIGLFDRDGKTLVDTVSFGLQKYDVSYGRYPDGSTTWHFFGKPTPLKENVVGSKNGFYSKPPHFSVKRGFYTGSVTISISSFSPKGAIYYTLDGNTPKDIPANLYSSPVRLDSTTVLRARIYEPGYLPSEVITHTYFINETCRLPIVSITTDSSHLWDWQTGIYALGPHAGDTAPFWNANFHRNWKRPAFFEYFDQQKNPSLSQNLDLKISGNWSRARPKKSFSLFADPKYGKDRISCTFFTDKDIRSFASLTLRADAVFGWHLKNEFIYTINKQNSNTVDMQAYTPTVLFLNGRYWGIYNLMERKGKDFIKNNHGFENIDMIGVEGEIIAGTNLHYLNMINFMNSHDISQDTIFKKLEHFLDIENFIDFWIYEIYSGKTDNSGNIRYWRPHGTFGKWRWISYDLDRWSRGDVLSHCNSHKKAKGIYLLGRMLNNKEFERNFTNRMCDLLNTELKPVRGLSHLNQILTIVEPEMERNVKRWGKEEKNDDYYPETMKSWRKKITWMQNFIQQRPDTLRQQMKHIVSCKTMANLTVNTNNSFFGKIRINTCIPSQYPWTGTYFQSIPLKISAIPNMGFTFYGWSDPTLPNKPNLSLALSGDYTVTAIFKKTDSTTVVINEIFYAPTKEFNPGQWIELYNPREFPLDLSLCRLHGKDTALGFLFPKHTLIEPHGYYILCRDSTAYRSYYPWTKSTVANRNMSLTHTGEKIVLKSNGDNRIDSLNFSNSSPWPLIPKDTPLSIELKSYGIDNSKGGNWTLSKKIGGTPGYGNEIKISNIKFKGLLKTIAPNPLTQSIRLHLNAPENSHLYLSLYTITGRKLQTHSQSVGTDASFVWNYSNDQGHSWPGGTYVLIIKLENAQGKTLLTTTKKVFFIR